MRLLPQERFSQENEEHKPESWRLRNNDIRDKLDDDEMTVKPIYKHDGVSDSIINKCHANNIDEGPPRFNGLARLHPIVRLSHRFYSHPGDNPVFGSDEIEIVVEISI